MASATRMASFITRLTFRQPWALLSSLLPRGYESSACTESFIPRSLPSFGKSTLPAPNREPRDQQNSLSSSADFWGPRSEFAMLPFWKRSFSSQIGVCGMQYVPNMTRGPPAGAQQMRTIMVEVKRNDLERAIRRWRRRCKEENLMSLKDREYFKKPSEKRVLALKERDRRLAKREFKKKLNWILGRRQRGF